MKSSPTPEPFRDAELEALICDCLDLLLPTLPPEQADIVRAIDLEEMPPQTVADNLGQSLHEVTRRLALGRQGLKDRIGEMHLIRTPHVPADCASDPKDDAGA